LIIVSEMAVIALRGHYRGKYFAQCSTVVKRWTEKLVRQWLKYGYVRQRAMMTKRNGDSERHRDQMTGGIPEQGTADSSV